MKFECPKCKKPGQIDDSKVPESGIYATCPQCNNRFLVKQEVSKDFEFESVKTVVQDAPRSETMTTPSYNNENTEPNTSRSIKPLKKINPHIYSIGAYGSLLCFISLYFFAKANNTGGMVVFGLIGLIGGCTACVYGLISLGRCWSIIQGTTARTTPGKAVGFLFIPFFNLYWTFIAYAGLATDANKYAESQRLKSSINYGLAVSACIIFFIPYLNFISFIFFSVLIYQMAAFHNEVIDKWDQLSELPDTSKSVNGIVVAASATFAAIVVIGILAAIAIPQFSAYRERAYKKTAFQSPSTNKNPYNPPVTVAQVHASPPGFEPFTGELDPVPANNPTTQPNLKPVVFNPFDYVADKNGFIIGDEVVTDTSTGLMWARNGNIAGIQMSRLDAINWADNLNYGGYNDWRLPTEEELYPFAMRGGDKAAESLNANGFINLMPSYYWSSSSYPDGRIFVMYMGMGHGDFNTVRRSCYVWPVRSGR